METTQHVIDYLAHSFCQLLSFSTECGEWQRGNEVMRWWVLTSQRCNAGVRDSKRQQETEGPLNVCVPYGSSVMNWQRNHQHTAADWSKIKQDHTKVCSVSAKHEPGWGTEPKNPLTVARNHLNKGANPNINFGNSLCPFSLKIREWQN